MTRLYWRIFLSFWVVIVVAAVLGVGVNALIFRAETDEVRAATLRSAIPALAEQAQRALETGGVAGLRTWLEQQRAERPVPPLVVITPSGQELLGRALPPLPPAMIERWRRQAPTPGTRLRGPAARMPARTLRAPDGSSYLLLVAPQDRAGRWFREQNARRAFMLLALIVSGVVCFALARHLTRPIRTLRATGSALAAGQLDVRAGPAVTARRDELGELGRELNRMADRIQQLLAGQQQLLRDLSHELRSPLTRLQAAVGLIRQRGGMAAEADLARLETEAARLDEQIGEILKLSRLAAIDRIERRPLDLDAIVRGIVEDARFEAGGGKHEVRYASTAVPPFAGDEALLHSAIENLVRNALQHARGSVEVALGMPAPETLRISVADDGAGVPEAELSRILEPFVRLPGSAAHRGGAGLGLAIASRAARLHGGRITARNRPSGGLQIDLELPAAGPGADAVARA